ILHDPSVVLFDEPYTGLDQEAAAILDGLLRDLAQQNRTIVMTTHDIQRGHLLASHVAIMSRGKIGFFGASHDIASSEILNIYTETIEAGQ
ncbi:MAG: sodium ABC transporter ATP-binding protein, partial [Anaerolineae bacterium]|nr:sodium ABC transporter ATP-binding protein [Anaerolineae bacterium]